MSAIETSDTASHRRDQIANFAEILRNSPARRKIFGAIYFGKKSVKSVADIAHTTGYTTKRVTEIAKPLASEKLFKQIRVELNGRKVTAYEAIGWVRTNKPKILQLSKNKKDLNNYETKTSPRYPKHALFEIKLKLQSKPARVKMVRVEDIVDFKKVNNVRVVSSVTPERLSENDFKNGLVKLLKLGSAPKDWGGEINDIFAATVLVGKKKLRGAFALKGPAKKGSLSPGKMGKNGDQIQRLFRSPADLFVVQYEGEIQQSVYEQMETFAKVKAALGTDVYYSVFDDVASKKLRIAYPKEFKAK
jgi:hypothetical protein